MSIPRHGGGEGLLEREVELESLERAIERACAGSGGAVVIEGNAGIGKTTLLDNVRLWDFQPYHDTITQRQALRTYYVFSDSDVDHLAARAGFAPYQALTSQRAARLIYRLPRGDAERRRDLVVIT